jgi:prepilin-type N-terminal cleavage/methylation domain-containing protein
MTNSPQKGFTLIELLVVIAIIGILSSVVLASLNTAKNKANDAKRMTDLNAIQTALEMYASTYNSYPVSPTWAWSSRCNAWPDLAGGDVIPGLVPTYLPKMPSDPAMDAVANTCCYLYLSNGTDYKLLAHNCPTSYKCSGSGEVNGGFYDPVRPTWSCQVSTQGGEGW